MTDRVKELISAEPGAAVNYKGTVNIVIKMYSTGHNNSSVAQLGSTSSMTYMDLWYWLIRHGASNNEMEGCCYIFA